MHSGLQNDGVKRNIIAPWIEPVLRALFSPNTNNIYMTDGESVMSS